MTTTTVTGAPVALSAITKRFGDAMVLSDLDLDIRAGEFLTLLGASGSGKSTLLNIIAGFIKPSSGTVRVDGRDLTVVPPHRRGFGMVFQNYSLFPHMTVTDNVAFPLRRHGWDRQAIAPAVGEALEMVQLSHLGNRKPAELSGGQQQRVALARAIVFRPPVLLMDEPLGALDKLLRDQLQLEIRKLHQELGTTFVFVTHDQDEALAMSDRIALLREGTIAQVGSPRELYQTPASRYVAEFVGASNIFTGTVTQDGFTEAGTGRVFELPSGARRDATCAMVRPERIRVLSPDHPGPAGAQLLGGVVEDDVYFGASRQVQIRTDDGHVLIARGPVPGVGDGDIITKGARVGVTWHREDLTLLSDQPVAIST